MSVEEVLAEVKKDQPFYESSGGGMTISGGEPMLQFQFATELLEAARSNGLHTCLETCGQTTTTMILAVQPLTDLFLFDIKETDNARHRQYTGAGNDRILTNLRAVHAAGGAILLRLPIVPGLNDRSDHFEAVAQLTRELPHLLGVEIMPYHRLGISKQARLGASPNQSLDIPAPSAATVAQWAHSLRQLGVHVVNACTAGVEDSGSNSKDE
jgi:pyruvate formate lyase activating enzyme